MADNEELVHKQQQRVLDVVGLAEGDEPEHVLPLGYAGTNIWGRRMQLLFAALGLAVVVLVAIFVANAIVAVAALVIVVIVLWLLARPSYPVGVVVTADQVYVVQLGLNRRVRAASLRHDTQFQRTDRGFAVVAGTERTCVEPTSLFAVQFEAFTMAMAGPVLPGDR